MTDFSDSYVLSDTVLEAYIGADPKVEAVALKAAVAATQEWYCRRATKIIDALPLRGIKYLTDGTQARQFPRQYREGYDMNEITGEAEVPQAVIDACCEEAIALYAHYADSDGLARSSLQKQGVKTYSLGGGYSETFGPSNDDKHYGLRSQEAYDLIAKHIARSIPIV